MNNEQKVGDLAASRVTEGDLIERLSSQGSSPPDTYMVMAKLGGRVSIRPSGRYQTLREDEVTISHAELETLWRPRPGNMDILIPWQEWPMLNVPLAPVKRPATEIDFLATKLMLLEARVNELEADDKEDTSEPESYPLLMVHMRCGRKGFPIAFQITDIRVECDNDVVLTLTKTYTGSTELSTFVVSLADFRKEWVLA